MTALTLARDRHFRLKKLGFLLPFAVALLPALGLAAIAAGMPRGLGVWLTPLAIFVLLPLVDAAVGPDAVNPDGDESRALAEDRFYRLLALLIVPTQLASVVCGAWYFASADLSAWEALGWILSVGTVTGGIGITVAHELIHKHARLDQWAGGVLLATAAYAGFKVEHVRGHHADVGTPADNTTARYGQNAYAYLGAAFAVNFRKAWRFEAARLRALGLPALHWQNELVSWHALTAAMAAGIAMAWGPMAFGFFVAQAVVGIALLEVVNYIEHYGLERRRLPDGRYEPVSELHSWNCNLLVSNLLLFQLQRHPDHHRYARRPYQLLRDVPEAPQLPAGYATMVLVALVPPLWFRLMNPRVARLRAPAASA